MKTTLPAGADGESSISLRTMPCPNSRDYAIIFTTTVTAPGKASGTTVVTVGACSTITLTIILGDAASAIELKGPISGEGPVDTARAGVPSIAYEEATKSAVQNIADAVSARAHSATSLATVGPERLTTQNGASAADPERDSSFLLQLYSDTEDGSSTRKPQNVTLFSAENTAGGTGGTIDPSNNRETSTHAMVMGFRNATSPPKESSGNVQGNDPPRAQFGSLWRQKSRVSLATKIQGLEAAVKANWQADREVPSHPCRFSFTEAFILRRFPPLLGINYLLIT